LDFKSIDWRSMQKYFTPKATNDLNDFLERLPQNVGKTALIAAGVAWMAASALGLYTYIQVVNMTELRAELKQTKALRPYVPLLKDKQANRKKVENMTATLKKAYPSLDIKQQGAKVQISSKGTSAFGAWREAVSHLQYGDRKWKVKVEKLCVGRGCPQNALGILLSINEVSVEKPKV